MAARLVAEKSAHDDAFKEKLIKAGQDILSSGSSEAANGSAAAAVRHDVAFHSMIYDFTGNPMIAPTLDTHWIFLRRVMVGILKHAERGQLVWEQHSDILASLVSGDADAAVALATDHVLGAQKALLETLASDEAETFFAEQEPR